jgi:hypothetical protein
MANADDKMTPIIGLDVWEVRAGGRCKGGRQLSSRRWWWSSSAHIIPPAAPI